MNKILDLFEKLKLEHGEALQGQWMLWCKRQKTVLQREEIIIGSILTQNTNWKNVGLALDNLKEAKVLSLKEINDLGKKDVEKLIELIRPAGYFNSKSKYLLSVSDYFLTNGGVKKIMEKELSVLRKEVLALKGVGPETCDSILLYALDKPIFVIDEYTRRISRREKISYKKDYHYLQKVFTRALLKDFGQYQDFHALIVINEQRMSRI